MAETYLTGKERVKVARLMAGLYYSGWSIRAIAVEAGMSYAATHRLLTHDANVVLRGRGGTRAAR